MSEIAKIMPAKTDGDRAKEIREHLGPLLEQVCEVLTRARAEGLQVNFQIGVDAYGRQRVTDLTILKVL